LRRLAVVLGERIEGRGEGGGARTCAPIEENGHSTREYHKLQGLK